MKLQITQEERSRLQRLAQDAAFFKSKHLEPEIQFLAGLLLRMSEPADPHHHECSYCHGSGKVTEYFTGDLMECAPCNGTGRIED